MVGRRIKDPKKKRGGGSNKELGNRNQAFNDEDDSHSIRFPKFSPHITSEISRVSGSQGMDESGKRGNGNGICGGGGNDCDGCGDGGAL